MKSKNTLTIKSLFVSVEEKEILHGVSMSVREGEVHAIMGPNGSGKSTLAYALMGHSQYKISKIKFQKDRQRTSILLGKRNLLELPTEERAKAGLFLAVQSPIAIPGVNVMELLRSSYQALHATISRSPSKIQNPVLARRWQTDGISLSKFIENIKSNAKLLRLDESFLHRSIHDGFSGGEKKKLEMLQAIILKPKFALFDEIDTGLDIDALKIVAQALSRLAKSGCGVIIITHYQRILKYLKPDYVHIFIDGRVVKTGRSNLAKTIEKDGYKNFV